MNCHECNCHTMPPCGACENCTHWDHPECENDCQTCEEHFDDDEYQAGCGSWDCRAPECGRA